MLKAATLLHRRPAEAPPAAAAAKKPRVGGAAGVRAMDDDDMFRSKPPQALGAGGLPASLKKVRRVQWSMVACTRVSHRVTASCLCGHAICHAGFVSAQAWRTRLHSSGNVYRPWTSAPPDALP